MNISSRPFARANISVAVFLILAILAAASWYAVSPRYTLARMQQAAIDGDADVLAAHVDFPSVRESLKSELRERLVTASGDAPANSLRSIGLNIAFKVIDQMVDTALTPENMGVVLASVRSTNQMVAPMGLGSLSVLAMPEVDITRNGLDSFRVMASENTGPSLVFRREGLNWQLAEIDLAQSDQPGDCTSDSAREGVARRSQNQSCR